MEQNTNQNPATGERTFTQDDVNRIVGERLAKEKARQDASFAEREQELSRREALFELKDQLKEMGLPSELLPVLNVHDKPALDKALEALKNYINEQTSRKGRKVIENRLPVVDFDTQAGEKLQLRRAMRLP